MFTDKDYEWLKVVECLKKSGLSIKDIKAFIEMIERGDDSLTERLKLFRSRREAVQKQMSDMQDTLDYLEFKCWYYEQSIKDGTEKRMRAIPVDELPQKYKNIKKKMNNIV